MYGHPFSQTLLFSSSRDYQAININSVYSYPKIIYCSGDHIAKMFFRNFLSGTLASWRALTPMDRNNLVLNVPPKMIGMFVACYGISAY